MAEKKVTPMMKQFNAIKERYPDVVLLFRCGDFYETYMDDAVRASEILGITLTRRSNKNVDGVQMAGFPHHALDTYLPKLVRMGLRVAICDQLEDPKKAKGLVKRGVTELVTPGVSTSDTTLDVKENNFLASIYQVKQEVGISLLDLSTGEFLVAQGNENYILKLINNFSPKEVLVERGQKKEMSEKYGHGFLWQEQEDWIFTEQSAKDRLLRHFETENLKGFGVSHLPLAVICAGSILYYMDDTYHQQLGHITTLSRIETDRYVWLDRFTIRNLELFDQGRVKNQCLFSVMDYTLTPMGGRMMRRWMNFPLKEVKEINDRLSVVDYFFQVPEFKEEVHTLLENIGDIERIASKVAVRRITPREVEVLSEALGAMAPLKEACEKADNPMLQVLATRIKPLPLLYQRIKRELADHPPMLVNKGHVIRSGVCAELDTLRSVAYSGKDYLKKIQKEESERTNIPSLKIGFNNVFGYYIEVRNMHKDKVPETWIRKQTLVNAERYITEELKEYESQILGAEDKIQSLEQDLFEQLVQAIFDELTPIQIDCQSIAQIDCLLSFALLSEKNHYFRPMVDDSRKIEIEGGRHPVIECNLPDGEPYVPNDLELDSEGQQIMIITGPNMSGKSALLRQTALIVLMAQMGCYVPATKAHIGVVDKIFTRVGANDNLASGESTFMVEMIEASNIINNLSDRSLILFDELGRGTSTYDGISIAWAIIEYIHQQPKMHARTLFATHYHELNDMAKHFSRIRNYNVSVKELDHKIVFLRTLQPGGSAHSFGIHVAKMAGMPKEVVSRADEILSELEERSKESATIVEDATSPLESKKKDKAQDKAQGMEGMQMSLFSLDDPLLLDLRDEILGVDIYHLTPIEALNKLNEIQALLTGKKK